MTEPVQTVPTAALRRLIESILLRHGAHPEVASDVCTALVNCSLRGIDTHGVNLLPRILKRVEAGRCQLHTPVSADPKEMGSAVLSVDAALSPGQHSGLAAARAAADLADKFGIGMCAVRNSTHFGAATAFLIEVLKHGFIGVAGSNSAPSMTAFGAPFVNLGNNPFGFAVPVADAADFLVDYSCGVMSFGQLGRIRAAGKPVPADAFVKPRNAPQDNPVYEIAGALEYAALPFGGHKGASVAVLVEVLAGLLSRGNVGMACETIADGRFQGPSHFVMALDPERVGVGDIASDMAAYLRDIRQGAGEVRLPGDNAEATMRARTDNGIPVSASDMDELAAAAAEAKIDFKELIEARA